jgi:hypothetical protein
MDRMEVQQDLRSAIAIAYELSRHEHVLHNERVAEALRELEAELARIEAKLGGPRGSEASASGLPPALQHVKAVIAEAGPVVGDQIHALLNSVDRISKALVAS